MNAFFASIEQLDHPCWRGRPVGVTNGSRGTCIITSSYEARALGIKTGMRVREARARSCHFIQAPSRPHRYAQISSSIMSALESLTPDIEIFSVDEAFLDFSCCQHLYDDTPYGIGLRIKRCVYDASGLLCSVGISGDKTTAKWAAKQQKPNGLTVVRPEEAEASLASVPVSELCGIGAGISYFLERHGVHLCGDMKKIPVSVLGRRFGNLGRRIWLMAQGRDPEPLLSEVKAPKTIGHGKVIPPNTCDKVVVSTYLMHMCEKVAVRLRRHNLQAQLFSIGLNTSRGWLNRKMKTELPTADGNHIMELAIGFIEGYWSGTGVNQVHVCALDPRSHQYQGDLFTYTELKREALLKTVDAVNQRFGEFAVCKAPLLKRSDMPNVISPAWKPSGHRNTLDY